MQTMVNDLRNRAFNAKRSVVKLTSIIESNGKKFGSTGSGFVVAIGGIVISNNHVVISDNPSSTTIHFNDGIEKKCIEIIRRDEVRDFVIIRIETGTYEAVELGSYD